MACFCEHGNEGLGSIQCEGLIKQVRNYCLHNNDSVPRRWLVITKLQSENSALFVQVFEACTMKSADCILTYKVLL